MPSYRITHDGELHYPPNRVAKPGDVVSDLPPGSVRWLLAEGLIADAGAAAPPATPGPQPDDRPTRILPALPDEPEAS